MSCCSRVLFVSAGAFGPASGTSLHGGGTTFVSSRRAVVLRSAKHSPHTTAPLLQTIPRDAHAPVLLLGIPNVFRRPRVSETVTTVEAAPAAPTTLQQGINTLRAHPFRGIAVLTMAIVLVQRLFKKRSSNSEASSLARPPTARAGGDGGGASSLSSRIRAVPQKHETTEEAMDLLGNTARKYVIVGGKGGVGKTSMSAAVATQFADRGQPTLIVSTDPAHSLSDAFGQSVSGGNPVPVLDIDNLYAQEVNPESMKKTFKMMSQMNGGAGAGMTGMGLEDMGLDDLNSLFDTLPPGFDEAVALVEIIKYIEGDPAYARFDRIVFDTAPTGHTLRLLALPDFLNGFFGKIISMKSKFGNMMNSLKGMFGGNDPSEDMDASMEDMEELKRSMAIVRDLFRDEVQTEFIVATIPNMMAIAESSRLVDELRKERIPVRHLFVNQLQPSNEDCTFCSARHREQSANLQYIKASFEGLNISTVQSFDREIKGAAALRAMGAQLFPGSATEYDAGRGGAGPSPNTSSAPLNGIGTSAPASSAETERPTPSAKAELVD